MHIGHTGGLGNGFRRESSLNPRARGEEGSSRFRSSMDCTATTGVLRKAKCSPNTIGQGFRLEQVTCGLACCA